VPNDISPRVRSKPARLPYRSIYAPSTTAPTGRIRNPAPKVANESISEAYGLCPGKKVRPIGPAKNPNTMKSYISRRLPLETRITFLILALRSVPAGWLLVLMIPGSNRDELWGNFLNYEICSFLPMKKGGVLVCSGNAFVPVIDFNQIIGK